MTYFLLRDYNILPKQAQARSAGLQRRQQSAEARCPRWARRGRWLQTHSSLQSGSALQEGLRAPTSLHGEKIQVCAMLETAEHRSCQEYRRTSAANTVARFYNRYLPRLGTSDPKLQLPSADWQVVCARLAALQLVLGACIAAHSNRLTRRSIFR